MRRRAVAVLVPIAIGVFACNAILGIEDLVDPGLPDGGGSGDAANDGTTNPDSPVEPTDAGMTPCSASPASDPCLVVVEQTEADGGAIYPTWPITFDEPYLEGMASLQPIRPEFDAAAPDTVTERVSGLTWQKSYLDGGVNYSHPAAAAACAKLGAGWRLPSRVEKATIQARVGDLATRVCLPSVFNGPATISWTSTAAPIDPSDKPRVFYHQDQAAGCAFGAIDPTDALNANYAVRCVNGPTKNATFHVSKKDDTVHAIETGLVWERTGVYVKTFAEAKAHCENERAMHVPVVQEIYGIIDTRTPKMFDDRLFVLPPRTGGVTRGLFSQTIFNTVDNGDGGKVVFYSGVALANAPYAAEESTVDGTTADMLLRCVRRFK